MSNLFDRETENALRNIFSSFKRKVVDYLITTPPNTRCETCDDAVRLAKELEGISNGVLEVRVVDKNSDVARALKPAYAPAWIYGTRRGNVRYYGLPTSQEFPPFIYMHQYIANNVINLSKEVVELIEPIDTLLQVKIFVTPECPYCPYVVDSFNQMGLVNDNILVETIEAVEFPWEADRYRVLTVPAVIISDVERVDGYTYPEIYAKLLRRAEVKLRGGRAIEEELEHEAGGSSDVRKSRRIKPHYHEYED